MKKKRFTEEQIIGELKEHESGCKMEDICRRHNIAQGTFYRRKSKYGGMEVNEAKRLKDFVSDQLANGRRFRILNVVDDFSRECVGQLVDVSISGHRLARFLTELMSQRKRPASIVCDNGTEFNSKAMFFWSKERQVKLNFIQPGKPTQNAFVESFNGKFRDACLNQYWFNSLDEAREEINQWGDHYNHVRPHSSLNYLPPSEYAKQVA